MAQEECGRMRHGKDSRNTAPPRRGEGKVDHFGADAAAVSIRMHGKRANFGEIRTVPFERQTAHQVSVFLEYEKIGDLAANLGFRARKQQPLFGVVPDQPVDRRSVGSSGLTRSHGLSPIFISRALNSSRAAPTAVGAVPPGTARRASADSTVSTVGRSRPKAGENSLSRSRGMSRIDFPSSSAARNTFPTISCASRKGTPNRTR